MSATEQKIKELLGNGLTNEVVANAVGVSPSYISQLMSGDTFANEVAELRTKTLLAATSRDRSWDGLEDRLLSKLSDIVDSGMIFKTQDVLRALVVTNNAKRRGNPAQEAFVAHKTVVNLNLPVMVLNKFKKNSLGEVVEVTTDKGTQTLVTMPAMTLMGKLMERRQSKDAKTDDYEQVRKFLPPSGKEKILEG